MEFASSTRATETSGDSTGSTRGIHSPRNRGAAAPEPGEVAPDEGPRRLLLPRRAGQVLDQASDRREGGGKAQHRAEREEPPHRSQVLSCREVGGRQFDTPPNGHGDRDRRGDRQPEEDGAGDAEREEHPELNADRGDPRRAPPSTALAEPRDGHGRCEHGGLQSVDRVWTGFRPSLGSSAATAAATIVIRPFDRATGVLNSRAPRGRGPKLERRASALIVAQPASPTGG